jgi:hypothetical protein
MSSPNPASVTAAEQSPERAEAERVLADATPYFEAFFAEALDEDVQESTKRWAYAVECYLATFDGEP